MNPNNLMDVSKAGWYVRHNPIPRGVRPIKSCYPKPSASQPRLGVVLMIVGFVFLFIAPPIGLALLAFGFGLL
ncbi:MAG TPA: hypothetical protein PK640_17770 [Verrucomicrobiota bacterium]|nr:hypothetical protein [Verrucomicrobiota bacterium]